MIVVATNNGKVFLEKLIASFEEFGTGGHRVAFIDTGSTDGSWEWLIQTIQNLHPTHPSWVIDQTPYRGYDTGAYIYAYRKYTNEDSFIFLHDSCRPAGPNWVSQFESAMVGDVGAVGITVYNGLFCHPAQPVWIDSVMPFKCAEINAPLGVGGPIFYTKRFILNLADARGCLNHVPKQKIEQMAMEGGWGCIIHFLGYRVVSATGFCYNIGEQTNASVNAALAGFMVKEEPKRL